MYDDSIDITWNYKALYVGVFKNLKESWKKTTNKIVSLIEERRSGTRRISCTNDR